MRRISTKFAKTGMILERAVYDSYGYEVVERGTEIDQKLLRTLQIHNVSELVIRDWRVYDVPVQPLISPEHEGRAVQALRTILTECHRSTEIEEILLEEAEGPVMQMTRELFPEVIGEVNAAGCLVSAEYNFIQPVKAAGLCLLMGRRVGFGMAELANLGLAALFKDIGAIMLPQGLMDKAEFSEEENAEVLKHPFYGAKIIGQYDRFSSDIVTTVAFHHERWDGSGYPKGLKADEIPLASRILAIADSYYELVSNRPGKSALMPHEAVEYIMAFGGELFDPKLVELFARHVPLYPTGVTVKLNSGELGIISDSNLGQIGRPVVRICYDEKARPIVEPFDVNLTDSEHQKLLIVEVLDY